MRNERLGERAAARGRDDERYDGEEPERRHVAERVLPLRYPVRGSVRKLYGAAAGGVART